MRLILLIFLFLILSCKESSTFKQEKSSLTEKAVKNGNIVSRDFFHEDLSFEFDYKIKFKRFQNIDKFHDSCIVKIFIVDKKTKKQVDSIDLSSLHYYDTVFKNVDNVRSDISGKNKNKGNDNLDNDAFGDIIIADFNFDTKEDIAVVRECSNSGNFYNFYIQTSERKFKRDNYLSDTVVYFPVKINKINKTLETDVVAGVCGYGEQIYFFNDKLNNWKLKSHKYINDCDNEKK